jgi:hypothetical protein
LQLVERCVLKRQKKSPDPVAAPRRRAQAEDYVALMTAVGYRDEASANAILLEVDPYSMISHMIGANLALIQINSELLGITPAEFLQNTGANIARSGKAAPS